MAASPLGALRAAKARLCAALMKHELMAKSAISLRHASHEELFQLRDGLGGKVPSIEKALESSPSQSNTSRFPLLKPSEVRVEKALDEASESSLLSSTNSIREMANGSRLIGSALRSASGWRKRGTGACGSPLFQSLTRPEAGEAVGKRVP